MLTLPSSTAPLSLGRRGGIGLLPWSGGPSSATWRPSTMLCHVQSMALALFLCTTPLPRSWRTSRGCSGIAVAFPVPSSGARLWRRFAMPHYDLMTSSMTGSSSCGPATSASLVQHALLPPIPPYACNFPRLMVPLRAFGAQLWHSPGSRGCHPHFPGLLVVVHLLATSPGTIRLLRLPPPSLVTALTRVLDEVH